MADADLLRDEVWRIFDLNPVRKTMFYFDDITYVASDRPCFSWGVTLKTLAAEGKLDRGRLLEASLGGLRQEHRGAQYGLVLQISRSARTDGGGAAKSASILLAIAQPSGPRHRCHEVLDALSVCWKKSHKLEAAVFL